MYCALCGSTDDSARLRPVPKVNDVLCHRCCLDWFREDMLLAGVSDDTFDQPWNARHLMALSMWANRGYDSQDLVGAFA